MMKGAYQICECQNWPRNINLEYLTNHHPNCSHYNDSLIDIWKVTSDDRTFYVESQQEACDYDDGTAIITKEKIHQEVFNNLPEFEGF